MLNTLPALAQAQEVAPATGTASLAWLLVAAIGAVYLTRRESGVKARHAAGEAL